MSRRGALVLGAILFAAGGALLAFAGAAGVTWGTLCGLAGLGLIGWGVLGRRSAG